MIISNSPSFFVLPQMWLYFIVYFNIYNNYALYNSNPSHITRLQRYSNMERHSEIDATVKSSRRFRFSSKTRISED